MTLVNQCGYRMLAATQGESDIFNLCLSMVANLLSSLLKDTANFVHFSSTSNDFSQIIAMSKGRKCFM